MAGKIREKKDDREKLIIGRRREWEGESGCFPKIDENRRHHPLATVTSSAPQQYMQQECEL